MLFRLSQKNCFFVFTCDPRVLLASLFSVETFSLYKASFVIFKGSRPFGIGFNPTVFAWSSLVAAATHRVVFLVPAMRLLRRVLRTTRLYLLQFGQRRVCSRLTVWTATFFGALTPFLWHQGWFLARSTAKPVCYQYRHVHCSEFLDVGLFLVQPNFFFFLFMLTNPYFWVLLQQSLASSYRSSS